MNLKVTLGFILVCGSAFAQTSPVLTPEQCAAVTDGSVIQIPVPKKLGYKAIEANSDRSITIFRPTVYRAGEARPLLSYSSVEGICSLLNKGPKEIFLAVDSKSRETKERMGLIAINANGVVEGIHQSESGTDVFEYVICRKKTKAEFAEEERAAKEQAEYEKQQRARQKAYEAQEAANYKKCLKTRESDRSIRCIPPRTGRYGGPLFNQLFN